LEVVYEGDEKAKEAKVQTYRTQFENLKMKEEEVVNSIRVAGEEVTDKPIVKKILRSLPMRYDAKISSVEDRFDLSSLTVDQLHGIFIAYEMRTGNNKSTKDEIAFKEFKTKINQKQKPQSCHHEESDVEETNFIRKLQKGSGKYKGKLPFKCFNCGKVGHFASKCPYPKEDPEEKEKKNKQYQKKEKPNYKENFYKGKNNFYSKEEDNNSSQSSDNDESDDDEVFFLGIEESNEIEKIKHEKELEDEAKVNMEEELLSALDELRKYKTRYRQLKSFVVEQKEKYEQEEKEMEKLMNDLKKQILEANKIEESLEKSLEEKQITVERIEAKIVHLKKELDAKIIQTKYENSSKILDKIITMQRDSGNKNGIDYSQKESHVNSKSYADALRNTFKKKNEEKISNDLNSRRLPPPIRKEGKTIPKNFYEDRYPRIFLGYFFACSNFGHKDINCRAYRKKNLKVKNYILKDKQAANRVKRRNFNSFDLKMKKT
jgi:hypothetical protein